MIIILIFKINIFADLILNEQIFCQKKKIYILKILKNKYFFYKINFIFFKFLIY